MVRQNTLSNVDSQGCDLVTYIPKKGPVLEFDLRSIRIGIAEYEKGPTGVTVVHFPRGAKGAVDVRGGAPGTINTDSLRLGYDERSVLSAVCIAGGSTYGLEAATGVAAELLSSGRADTFWKSRIPIVPGAILYDFGLRFNAIYPDKALGRAALRAAHSGEILLGAVGAGRSARQGAYFGENEPSGQGAAFGRLGKTCVLVITVVNSFGAVVGRSGNLVRCNHLKASGIGISISKHLEKAATSLSGSNLRRKSASSQHLPATSHSTITVVITNQQLLYSQLLRLAVQTHTSMGRAIQPFHTLLDGDTLFAVSTGEVCNPGLNEVHLGVFASELAWDAVLASVPSHTRTVRKNTELPNFEELARFAGTYEFRKGAVLTFRKLGPQLEARSTGQEQIYDIPKDRWVAVIPEFKFVFLLPSRWNHRFQFEPGPREQIDRVLLNPGPWCVIGKKIRRSA